MRSEVVRFAEEMERVLKLNDWKGSWGPEACTMTHLRKRLDDEIKEYQESKEPLELIDVANFCMFLWIRGKR